MNKTSAIAFDPQLSSVFEKEETLWLNPRLLPFSFTKGVCQLIVSEQDIQDAANRLERFAPFIQKAYPETVSTKGLIESPLVSIGEMQKALSKTAAPLTGNLYLKLDSHLAIAGSVKARGGIYEVLKHAEDLAIADGKLLPSDSYEKFADPKMKAFFSSYKIQVGSTGNLGMSIGIMSAALGFQVIVHMSADAKQWKKDLLREKGVTVIEYEEDYSKAVAEGRKSSDADPMSYFVDDENSKNLFLGYAVAASRLKQQFDAQNILVDKDHPLFVYIPTGVGGAPGGVAYGLKQLFGDDVHCFFVEPTECPSVLLGCATQTFEQANVRNYDISGQTHADGLACASPSGFVTRIMTNLLSGDFTISDFRLYDYLRLLKASEDLLIEPSSCAAFIGPVQLFNTEKGRSYLEKQGLTERIMNQSTHICWATGGKLVPDAIWDEYLNTYL